MKFIFKTSATMKGYNRDKWWIDEGIIGEKIIAADTVTVNLPSGRTFSRSWASVTDLYESLRRTVLYEDRY